MKATHEQYRSWYKVGRTAAAAEQYSRVPVLHYIIHLDVSCKEHLVTFEFVCRDIKKRRTYGHTEQQSPTWLIQSPLLWREHIRWKKKKKNAHSESKRICCYVGLTFVKCLIRAGADKTVHSLANNFWFRFSHFKCWALKASFSFPLCK